MIHTIFYWLHIAGMLGVVLLSLDLLFNGKFAQKNKKKTASTLASIAHSQVLLGFVLFYIKLSEINHAKVGIKIILAIFAAVLITIYSKQVKLEKIPNKLFLPVSLLLVFAITAIAFLWK